jgi:hypothetical protein
MTPEDEADQFLSTCLNTRVELIRMLKDGNVDLIAKAPYGTRILSLREREIMAAAIGYVLNGNGGFQVNEKAI